MPLPANLRHFRQPGAIVSRGIAAQGFGTADGETLSDRVKQFTKWLVTDRRTNDNRLVHLKGGNPKLDVRRKRRELTDDEIRKLLHAAKGGNTIYGLSGEQRFLLYATAIGSGFRASELATLTPAHFDLQASPPTVSVLAADEKSRREATIPLPPDLVALLAPVVAQLPMDARLWPGPWAEKHNGCKLIQHDLKRAGVPYKTDEGQADFHSLRHTFLSRLGRSGASPKAMQRLARHTTVELTLGRYTHANLYDLASAVEALPPLPIGEPTNGSESQMLGATGTDDNSVQGRDCPSVVEHLVEHMVEQPADSDDERLRTIEFPKGTERDSDGPPPNAKNPLKTRGSEADCGLLSPADEENGSGWESNPPDRFSAVSPGLKPGAVTRSAYTPSGALLQHTHFQRPLPAGRIIPANGSVVLYRGKRRRVGGSRRFLVKRR